MATPRWVEGAGGWLLLAGAHATGVVAALEHAVAGARAPAGSRLAHQRPQTRRGLLRTLLFLPVVGLGRPWDLRAYGGEGLALLSGRRQAYGYRTLERFLRELAAAGGAHTVTDVLGQWTTQVWQPQRPGVAGTPVLAALVIRPYMERHPSHGNHSAPMRRAQ